MNLESPLWRRCYLHLRWYFWRKKPNKSVFRAQFCLLHMLVKHNFFHNTSDNNHLSWATATLARQRIATRRAISSFDTELEESWVLGGWWGDARGHWAGRRAPADWALKVEPPSDIYFTNQNVSATRLHFDRYSEIQQKITNKDFMKNHEFSWRNKIPKKFGPPSNIYILPNQNVSTSTLIATHPNLSSTGDSNFKEAGTES